MKSSGATKNRTIAAGIAGILLFAMLSGGATFYAASKLTSQRASNPTPDETTMTETTTTTPDITITDTTAPTPGTTTPDPDKTEPSDADITIKIEDPSKNSQTTPEETTTVPIIVGGGNVGIGNEYSPDISIPIP